MIDFIWLGLLVVGLAVAAATGRVDQVTEAVMASSQVAVETVIGFLGVTSLWLGIMKIAEEAGLVASLARGLRPLMRRLFPGIPAGDPALGAVVMSISANILGVGPAATPLGLKAMQELQRINPHKHAASDAMVTFLAMTTSGITLIPATVIAVRAAAGSAAPAEIVGPTLVASTVATAVALLADRLLRPLVPAPPPPPGQDPPAGPPPDQAGGGTGGPAPGAEPGSAAGSPAGGGRVLIAGGGPAAAGGGSPAFLDGRAMAVRAPEATEGPGGGEPAARSPGAPGGRSGGSAVSTAGAPVLAGSCAGLRPSPPLPASPAPSTTGPSGRRAG